MRAYPHNHRQDIRSLSAHKPSTPLSRKKDRMPSRAFTIIPHLYQVKTRSYVCLKNKDYCSYEKIVKYETLIFSPLFKYLAGNMTKPLMYIPGVLSRCTVVA